MKEKQLIVGSYIGRVECENFLDIETNRIRVRPLPGQGIATTLVIECLKSIRENSPLGTKFYTSDAKVCTKPNGRVYLRAEGQMLYELKDQG